MFILQGVSRTSLTEIINQLYSQKYGPIFNEEFHSRQVTKHHVHNDEEKTTSSEKLKTYMNVYLLPYSELIFPVCQVILWAQSLPIQQN